MQRSDPLPISIFCLAIQSIRWHNNVESKFNELQLNIIGGVAMFIGREKELALLQQDYIGKGVMVYGKRRVGKTTPIEDKLDEKKTRPIITAAISAAPVSAAK